MKNCYDYEKINAYIDNELSRDERNQFEVELNSDPNLQNEVNSIKNLLNDLKELPKVETDRNFMVSLNKKIDEYELSKGKKWYSNILSDFTPMQVGFSALSIVFIVSLTIFMSQTSSNNQNLNAAKEVEKNNNSVTIDTTKSSDPSTISQPSSIVDTDEDEEEPPR